LQFFGTAKLNTLDSARYFIKAARRLRKRLSPRDRARLV